MAEIEYRKLREHLKAFKKEGPVPVYLLYGDEFFYKSALEALSAAIAPEPENRLNFDVVDDNGDNVQEVIERVSTYSLLSGPKVVVFRDVKLFQSSLDVSAFLEKAKAAYDGNDTKKASKYILDLMARLKLGYADVGDPAGRRKRFKYDPALFGDDAWLAKTIAACMEIGLEVPPARDHADLLQAAVEKGFPRGNHLIITADMVDKRRSLFKCILKAGAVVDCSVPRGERHADKTAQAALLNEQLRSLLSKAGKSMAREAVELLIELTGFDLRTFAGNIEKLISYTGERPAISAEDVETVLSRTRKDPLYELTNAVAERNVRSAVFFMNSLLADNYHPLQLLAAVANQVRKLLIVRDFLESSLGRRSWQGGKNYQRFKDAVIPAMQAYDEAMLAACENRTAPEKAASPGKKDRVKTDLAIVKNPQNPYPVLQTAQKAEGFTLQELRSALAIVAEADRELKSTSRDNRLVLENLILAICRRAENDRIRREHAESA